jgi:hypothetical protein
MPCQQRRNGRFLGESRVSRARDGRASRRSRAALLAAALAAAAWSGAPRAARAQRAEARSDADAAGSRTAVEGEGVGSAGAARASTADRTTARPATAPPASVDDRRLRLEPPPLPSQRPSVLGWELHALMVLPLADALCPAGEACLLNEGVGLGGSVERRWPFGGALVLGYDLALLEGGGIFEVGTLQVLRAGVKWVIPIDRATKPYLGVDVGAVLFGDSFDVATAGGTVQLDAGAEVELTHRYALTLGLVFRAITTGGFVSLGDSVARGRDPSASLALVVQVGLAFLEDPTELLDDPVLPPGAARAASN